MRWNMVKKNKLEYGKMDIKENRKVKEQGKSIRKFIKLRNRV